MFSITARPSIESPTSRLEWIMPDDKAEKQQDQNAPIKPEELDEVSGGALNAYEKPQILNESGGQITATWVEGG
jgi:hypothetical protein